MTSISTQLCAGSTLALLLSSQAWAGSPPAPQSEDGPNQIAEIVVTAQRRAESLQDVPLSITAITPKSLSDRHISDTSQLASIAPSLQVSTNNNSGTAAAFSVRGVGTLSFSPVIESSVGVVIDDIAMIRPETAALDFYDIANVEVLNGPQGMLFGKNASAGLVKVSTNAPKLSETSAQVDGEYGVMSTPGNGQQYSTHAVVNIPVTSDSAIRLSGSLRHFGPLVRNVFTSSDQNGGLFKGGVRLRYLWSPGAAFRLLVSGDYTYGRGMAGEQATYRYHAPGPLAASDAALGVVPGPNNVSNSSNAPSSQHYRVGGLQINTAYTFSNGGTLTNILAWRRFTQQRLIDYDYSSINILDNLSNDPLRYTQFSNELRYASSSHAKLEYQFGLFYIKGTNFLGNTELSGNAGLGNPPPGFTSWIAGRPVQVQHIDSIAPFGQATFHVTDKLAVTGGLRYTHDRTDTEGENRPTTAAINLLPLGPLPKTTIKADNLSWRASVQYNATSTIMGYVTAARGYKGPGFNSFSAVPVLPEISHHYEIGLKSTWFNRRLLFNVSLFDETFNAFQATTAVPTPPFYETVNAGTLKARGFEAEVRALILDGLTLQGNVSHSNAHFASFLADQCYAAEPVGTAPARNVCFGGSSNSSGNMLPNAPRWSGTISADYERPINEDLKWNAHASLYSRSKVNFSSNADPRRAQEDYSILTANLGIESDVGGWSLSVFCKNCLDRRFASYIVQNPFVPTDYFQLFSPDSFRTIGLSASKRF